MASAAVMTSTVTQEAAACSAHIVLALPSQRKQPLCYDPVAQVMSGLLIGSKESESCLAGLRAAGVTHILQCGVELMPSHKDHFVYKQLKICDKEYEDVVGVFSEAFEFINEARKTGTVLVHCAQGISRSAAVVIGYLMNHSRMTYTAALAQVQQARPVVNPNEGFVLQLQKFGHLNCNPKLWSGWNEERLEKALRESSVSGRREVRGLSDMIRRFHVSADEDDSTVFCDTSVML